MYQSEVWCSLPWVFFFLTIPDLVRAQVDPWTYCWTLPIVQYVPTLLQPHE